MERAEVADGEEAALDWAEAEWPGVAEADTPPALTANTYRGTCCSDLLSRIEGDQTIQNIQIFQILKIPRLKYSWVRLA